MSVGIEPVLAYNVFLPV